ncbi:MAG: guanylate kinase [Acidobacteria bacterium]|jgi:guanylate kinase|nr:guanylate kinase [Acidobacteriota bacterium]
MQDEKHDELHGSPSLVVIVSGPGGVGKGTIVEALVARDERLWLSRSWTTRGRRDGERHDAYHFVSRDEFEDRIANSGFLEWTSFLGNYYGTPLPEAIDGRDLVLEIEVDGARQVKLLHPDAVLVFLLPPSRLEQQRRLRGRGDAEDKVEERLRKAEEEEPVGIAMADHVVVNDDLELTLQELVRIVNHERKRRISR